MNAPNQTQQPNGQKLAKREPDKVKIVGARLEELKDQLRAALPKHLTPERITRVVLTTMRQNPKLAECSQSSLLASIFMSSQLGLEIGPHLGLAYLVPYKEEAQLIIGYKGLVELARRSGQISTVYAQEVYDCDQFAYQLGTDPKIEHSPGTKNDKSRVTHVYAVAKLKDGGTQFEVMTLADVEAIKKRSRAASSGPWVTDFAMMARKTVLRRLCKMLPASTEDTRLQRAIVLDEAVDANTRQLFDVDMPELAAESLPVPGEVVDEETGEVLSKDGE